MGVPWWLRWSGVCLQCWRHGFDPWVGKIPWERKWQPTPVFLSGKIPWTEKPGRLQSMGSQRVWHKWVANKELSAFLIGQFCWLYILFVFLFLLLFRAFLHFLHNNFNGYRIIGFLFSTFCTSHCSLFFLPRFLVRNHVILYFILFYYFIIVRLIFPCIWFSAIWI